MNFKVNKARLKRVIGRNKKKAADAHNTAYSDNSLSLRKKRVLLSNLYYGSRNFNFD